MLIVFCVQAQQIELEKDHPKKKIFIMFKRTRIPIILSSEVGCSCTGRFC